MNLAPVNGPRAARIKRALSVASPRLRLAARLRLVSVAMLVVSVTACAPLPTRSIVSSHADALAVETHPLAPPSETGFPAVYATPALRRATLDRVWRTIEDEYYDPRFEGIDLAGLEARSRAELADVRSDADFYRVLQRSVAAMHDSHTGILTPLQAEGERAQRAQRIGLTYGIVEERVVVDEVLAGSAAEEAGVRRGMIIEVIDGHVLDAAFLSAAGRAAPDAAVDTTKAPAAAVAGVVANDASTDGTVRRQLEAVGALLDSRDGETDAHRVGFRRADDTLLTVDLRARMQDFPPVVRYTLRPSGVGVLRLSRFDPSILQQLEDAVETARGDSRALILDLRDDPGGDVDMMQQLLDRLIDHPESLGTVRIRLWRWTLALDVDGDPVEHPYLKPLAVLIDGGTASAAEWTAHALVELRDAIAVGEPTCGCVVGIRREFVLPDGGVLRVAEFGVRSPRGRRMEDDPLTPTLAVTPTFANLREDDDVVMEAAERALQALITPARRAEPGVGERTGGGAAAR